MRCSHAEFEAVPETHRRSIIARGFARVRQLNYSRNPLRQLWRRASGKRWDGYRTRWRAWHPIAGDAFIKVYFGHRDSNVGFIYSEKEYRLHSHFSAFLEKLGMIRQMVPIDYWKGNAFAGVAYRWCDMSMVSLAEATAIPRHLKAISCLLRTLAGVSAPSWWDRTREPHNFACSEYGSSDFSFAAPFNIDLPLNLAVDHATGCLHFFDLEKYQWGRAGLQEMQLAIWLWFSRWSVGKSVTDEEVSALLGHVPLTARIRAMPQCWRALRSYHATGCVMATFQSGEQKSAEELLLGQ